MEAARRMMGEVPDAMPTKPPVKRRSWRVRWSLRLFFLLIALAAGGFGWLSYYMRIGYLHEDVAAKLTEVKGRVSWTLYKTAPLSPPTTNASGGMIYTFLTREIKGGPEWMQNLGVEPAYQRIRRIILFPATGQEKMEIAANEIDRLDRIEELNIIDGHSLTPQHLARMLDGLKIEKLRAPNVQVEPGELPWLRSTELQHLALPMTGFADEAIDDLPETLVSADLGGTQITDVGLEKFVRLKNLKLLNLKGAVLSEAAVADLRRKMPWCTIEWEPLSP